MKPGRTTIPKLTPPCGFPSLVGVQPRAVNCFAELISDSRDAPSAPASSMRIDIETLVGSVCDLLADRATKAGVRLVVECRGGVLRGNAAALHDILFNLAGNAIEATPPGCSVHLETLVTAAGDHLWIIREPGRGMATKVVLSASEAIRHAGALVLQSHEAEETTVGVWLPREVFSLSVPRAQNVVTVKSTGGF